MEKSCKFPIIKKNQSNMRKKLIGKFQLVKAGIEEFKIIKFMKSSRSVLSVYLTVRSNIIFLKKFISKAVNYFSAQEVYYLYYST